MTQEKPPELDPVSLRILEAILHKGGEATTSEIKKRTGDELNKIQYRTRRKLTNHGLIETENRGTDSQGRNLPNLCTLTDKGREALADQAEKLEEEDEETKDDRIGENAEKIQRLERRIEALNQGGTNEYRQIDKRLNEVETRLDETEKRLKQVYEGYIAVREYLRQEHGVEDLGPYKDDAPDELLKVLEESE